MAEAVITLRLTILDPVPGVRYSLQKDDAPLDPQTATREHLSFDLPVKLADDGRLLGPFIRREGPVRRFVYLRIGQSAGDCASPWIAGPRLTSMTFRHRCGSRVPCSK